MKNVNIFGVHWKIPFLGGGFTKNRYRVGDCLKGGGACAVCRFKEGGGVLARKRVVVFLRGGDTPIYTKHDNTCWTKQYIIDNKSNKSSFSLCSLTVKPSFNGTIAFECDLTWFCFFFISFTCTVRFLFYSLFTFSSCTNKTGWLQDEY